MGVGPSRQIGDLVGAQSPLPCRGGVGDDDGRAHVHVHDGVHVLGVRRVDHAVVGCDRHDLLRAAPGVANHDTGLATATALKPRHEVADGRRGGWRGPGPHRGRRPTPPARTWRWPGPVRGRVPPGAAPTSGSSGGHVSGQPSADGQSSSTPCFLAPPPRGQGLGPGDRGRGAGPPPATSSAARLTSHWGIDPPMPEQRASARGRTQAAGELGRGVAVAQRQRVDHEEWVRSGQQHGAGR